ncbi:hypothetical protein ACH5RR_031850, partial [Cinchona calisaya]
MPAAWRFDDIDSVLGKLRKHYYKHMGCDRDSDDRFFNSVNKIKTDWELLKMLRALLDMGLKKFFLENAKDLISMITNTAEKFWFFFTAEMHKKKDYSAEELVELALEGQRISEELIVTGIREVAHQWFCCEEDVLVLKIRADDNYFWTYFFGYVMSSLRSIGWCGFRNDDDPDIRLVVLVSTFNKEVKLLCDYIIVFNAVLDVDDFVNVVASVILRAAIRSCNYWFLQNTDPNQLQPKCLIAKLLDDLQNEIDPTKNPNFMSLHLKSLIALNRMAIIFRHNPTRYGIDFIRCFCGFVLTNEDLKNELNSLLILFINNQLEEEEEEQEGDSFDVRSFFAEISVLLVEVRRQGATPYPRITELLVKICLAKAELFLKEQLLYHHNITTTLSDGEGLKGILQNMRRFSKDLPKEKIEYGEQSLVLIGEVAMDVASLPQPFEAGKMAIPEFAKVKNSRRRFLLKIVMFKAESFLAELLLLKTSSDGNAATVVAYEKVLIDFLLQQLKLLNLILINQIMEDREGLEKFFAPIVTFARRVTCFSYSFLNHEIPNDMIRQMTLSFLELLDDANHIRLKLKEIGPQLLLPNFPRTYKLGFVEFLLRNLGELLKYDPGSIAPVKLQIEEIRLHIKSLSSFLMKVSESDIEHPKLKDLGNQVIDVAYKVEFVVDSIETGAQWQYFFWFYDLLVELRLLDKQAFQIQTTVSDDKAHNISQ